MPSAVRPCRVHQQDYVAAVPFVFTMFKFKSIEKQKHCKQNAGAARPRKPIAIAIMWQYSQLWFRPILHILYFICILYMCSARLPHQKICERNVGALRPCELTPSIHYVTVWPIMLTLPQHCYIFKNQTEQKQIFQSIVLLKTKNSYPTSLFYHQHIYCPRLPNQKHCQRTAVDSRPRGLY